MEIERSPTSTLIKRLRDASRAKSRSLGFGRRDDERAAPAMVLVAQVSGLDAAAAAAAVHGGAAAIAFALTSAEAIALAKGQITDLEAGLQACGSAVPGLLFSGDALPPVDLARRLDGVGVDFVIASVDRAPAALMGQEGLGLIARIDDYGEHPAFLRGLGELRVDGVVAGRRHASSGYQDLTVSDLMGYKLVVESVRQPVLVIADGAIRPDNLQALRDLGVDGVIVTISALPGGELGPFREAVAKLKITRRASAGGDSGSLVPRLGRSDDGTSDEDPDDDD